MKRVLQSLDFKSNKYERPSQNWVCGRSADGKPCRLGPDGRGRCRATFECSPRRDGDRWLCSRAPSAGGACQDGPLPDGICCQSVTRCVPARSLRAKRRSAVLWVTAMAIGLIAIILEGSVTAMVLSPGPVTVQHSQVESCDGCHQDFEAGLSSWVHAAVTPGNGIEESKLCLECHGKRGDAFAPHSLVPSELAAMAKEVTARKTSGKTPLQLDLARQAFGSPGEVADQLSCGTCHKEHQGRDADLKVLSNGQCQSCHSVTFESFSNGHTEFEAYPYGRRTRINFDHWSHIERHFPETIAKRPAVSTPETCTECHLPSDDGELMLVRSFDETCSACHLTQIEGEGLSGPQGIVFLTVPGFDVETLQDEGIEIGEWPEFAEEKITPFVRLMLTQEDGMAESLARLDGLDDLLDLTEATPEDLAAVEQTVWAVKGLLHDVLIKGMAPMGDMIGASMGEDMSRTKLAKLLGTVPFDVLRATQETWFPSLFKEVAMRRQGIPMVSPGSEEDSEEDAPEADAAEATETAVGDEDILSGDDDILSGDDGDILAEGEDILSGDDDILSGDDDDILAEGEDILSDDDDILSGDDDILSGDDDDILAEGEDILSDDNDILSGDDDILSGDDEDILSEGEDILSGDEDAGDAEASEPAAQEVELDMADPADVDRESWAKLGGWYRADFALYYKPIGHEDSFLSAWLDLSGEAAGPPGEDSIGRSLFESLVAGNAPGRCAKCHGIEQVADRGLRMNWTPRQKDQSYRHATVFSHTTHFSLLDEKGCTTCHEINKEAKYLAAFEQRDPESFESNFHPLKKATCSQCHVEDLAGDTCLDCHQYHLGNFPGAVVKTLMGGDGTVAQATE